MRALSLLTLLLSGSALSQALIPLDSRPATRVMPALMARLTSQQVNVPPITLLGTAKQGADPSKLYAWLNKQPNNKPLIVALDALAYGGLVQSRKSPINADEAIKRLEPLKAWKEQNQQPIYAFITLPREPDATNRERNLMVVRRMMEWADEDIFQELHITWDDALPGSPAPQEGKELASEAPRNVHVYPGADEVLSMLAARALAWPARTVRLEYSDPKAAQKVMKYEGIPLTESAHNHALAAGFIVTQSDNAELTLYIYNGGKPRWAAVRISQLLRQGAVAVADVAHVNLGNVNLWKDLNTLKRSKNLKALAAWGTPGNNLGSALSHAKIALEGVDSRRQDALLAHEYANDIIYSANVRAQLRKRVPEKEMGTPAAQKALLSLAKNYFPIQLDQSYELKEAGLPWNRSFEWDFMLQPK